jgi:transposase
VASSKRTLERETGIEPATNGLGSRYSTIELLPPEHKFDYRADLADQALGPVLQQIAEMTLKTKQYDRQIQLLTQTEYPETQALLKVQDVGYITALTLVLTLGNKERFGRSRDVGCYLGLRPRRSQSGETRPTTQHHQGRQRLSPKSADRVREPHPTTAGERLFTASERFRICDPKPRTG